MLALTSNIPPVIPPLPVSSVAVEVTVPVPTVTYAIAPELIPAIAPLCEPPFVPVVLVEIPLI